MKNNILFILLIAASINLTGQNQFHKIFGGSDHERAQTVFSTHDNCYIVNGATISFGQGYVDAILMKLDSAGNILWSNTYGTPGYENSEFSLETFDHNFICAGSSGGMTPPFAATIFKTDSVGSFLWGKTFSGGSSNAFSQIIETSDNGYAAVGNRENSANGSLDFLLVKTDINGDTIFTRTYGSPLTEAPVSVIQLADDGFLMAGKQTFSTASGLQSNGILLRTNSSGDMLWVKQYGDTLWEELTQARISPNGFWVTGSTVSYGAGGYDFLLMETDTGGVPLWSKTFGGTLLDAAYDLHITHDSSLLVSGYTASYGHGHERGDDSLNIFLLKADQSGNMDWMQTYGDGLQDEGFRSAVTSDGGYMMGGFTTSYNLTDSSEMLIVKTNSMGLTGCHEVTVTPLESTFTMPSDTLDTTIFVQSAGLSINTILLIPATANIIDQDACTILNVSESNSAVGINSYPNPFDDHLTIDLQNNVSGEIVIRNVLGMEALKQKITGSKAKINTGELNKGIYFLSIEENGRSNKGIVICK